MAFAPTAIGSGRDLQAFAPGVTLPPSLGDGLLARLSGTGDSTLQSLAQPSELTALYQKGLQDQQLAQLAQLLVSLLGNQARGQTGNAGVNAANTTGVDAVNSAGSSSQAGAGGSSSATSGSGAAGAAAEASDAAAKGDGSSVTRQGKPIGAHIAQKFDEMVAAAKKDGVELKISSGLRTRAEQERLYAAYKNGTGNLAAKPGTSNHESGSAVDFANTPGAYNWLKKNSERFGFKNLPSEPWHYSLNGR